MQDCQNHFGKRDILKISLFIMFIFQADTVE